MVEQAKKQEVMAKPDERIVKYQAADGQEISLSMDIVKRYLVQGNSELITTQELMYFLNICRARRLNPLVKDCYLIKYSQDPAAIVTSIDFFRKRARAQKDCVGWEKGIIVRTKEGKVKDSFGLVDEGETLIGGWFKAMPSGWTVPFRLEVNLSGYLKYKNIYENNRLVGKEVTKFWQPENQPTMIAKVAEAQGLRTLWPDEFQSLLTPEEGQVGVFDIPEAIDLETYGRFDELVAEIKLSKEDQTLFGEYIKYQADKKKVDIYTLKGMAEKDFTNFMEYFKVFKTRTKDEAKAKTPVTQKEKEPDKQEKMDPQGQKKEEEKNSGSLFDKGKELRGEGEKPIK